MKLPVRTQRAITLFRSDHRSGAASLTKRAADILLQLVEHTKDPTPSFLVPLIQQAIGELRTAQPVMVSVYRLTDQIVTQIKKAKARQDLRKIVDRTVKQFLNRLNRNNSRVARHASSLIRSGMTILTHSNSSLVQQAFLRARSQGKRFRVVCTESRPLSEGVQLARSLAEKGIPVDLIVDAAMFAFLADVQMVFVGVDAVTKKGLIHKIGTSGLARAARTFHIPFYALGSSDKFAPEDHSLPFHQRKSPSEIFGRKFRGITPVNIYFDRTPLKDLTGMINEEGVLSVKILRQNLALFSRR